MKNSYYYVFALGFVLLTACESEPGETLQESLNNNSVDQASIAATLAINSDDQAVGTAATFSNYDPTMSQIPSAIDILLSGSEDGTLNIPITVNDPQEALKTALNALDGFSTVTPISTGFTAALDPATITPAAVRVFEVGLSRLGGAVVSIKRELTFALDGDFIATLSSIDPTNSTLVVVPLKPLDPKTSYYVVVSNSLKDMNGDSVGASPTYTAFKGSTPLPDPTAELLRQLVSTSEFTADFAHEDLAAINIVVSWSFTTQSVGDVLTVTRGLAGTVATDIKPSTAVVGSSGAGKSPLGLANMFEGTIDVPYYLTAPSTADPTANLTKHWQAVNAVGGENNLTHLNPLPASTATLSIPLLVTTPVDTATFPAPWKTVIFQHGITSDRTVMLAVADSLAQAGFAVLAIDMPLHGVNSTSPFYQAGNERTFDVDFLTEGGLVPVPSPDGIIDSSGAHFVNLSSLLLIRDNVRQSVADLFALTSAVPSIDVDKNGTPDLDADNIYFVGHSLGAMVGATFVALDSRIKDVVFAMGGGSFAKILDGSAAFSPGLVAGLVAASGGLIDKNAVGDARIAYESFFGVAQTVVDSGDPINYTTGAVADRGVLYFEIVGDGTPGTSDLVIPNTVPDALAEISVPATVPAPLAGTEPLLTLMNLTQVNSTQTDSDLKLSVKFTSGDHSSFLSTDADAAVTAEMQTEMASFLAQDGNALTVLDDTVIQAP